MLDFSSKGWSTGLVWLHNISDLGIGMACLTISTTLLYVFVKKGKTPFRYIWWFFVIFIISCGLTHFMEVITTWHPAERFAGVLKLMTSTVSWLTVFVLWKSMPHIIQMKTELAQRTLELQLKTAEFQQALEKEEKLKMTLREREQELVEHEKRKTNFLAMLAHELRNPLAPVRTTIHIIKERYGNQLDAKYHELDSMMCRQLNHLSNMIDDLLDVSRITSGKIKLLMEKTQVYACINGAITVLESHFSTEKHSLQVHCPTDIFVLADSTRLEQILTNLLQNAIKYTPEGKEISVNVSKDEHFACIIVKDNGKGIDPAVMPNIFQLFYQSEQSVERTSGGLGIGLTIVKNLVDLHGGTISVESALGVGSTFTIRLVLMDER